MIFVNRLWHQQSQPASKQSILYPSAATFDRLPILQPSILQRNPSPRQPELQVKPRKSQIQTQQVWIMYVYTKVYLIADTNICNIVYHNHLASHKRQEYKEYIMLIRFDTIQHSTILPRVRQKSTPYARRVRQKMYVQRYPISAHQGGERGGKVS